MLLAKSPRLEDATRTLIAPVRLHVFLPCQLKRCHALVVYHALQVMYQPHVDVLMSRCSQQHGRHDAKPATTGLSWQETCSHTQDLGRHYKTEVANVLVFATSNMHCDRLAASSDHYCYARCLNVAWVSPVQCQCIPGCGAIVGRVGGSCLHHHTPRLGSSRHAHAGHAVQDLRTCEDSLRTSQKTTSVVPKHHLGSEQYQIWLLSRTWLMRRLLVR